MATQLVTSTRTPVLVTGMPRSGTTWVARQLAWARGTALAGREPMNPRPSQHALGGTLTRWTKLEEPTARQRRLLRAAYQGWDPRVYSRYGYRQWAAAWPSVRVVVKDPFALLSLPTVVEITGALPVVVFRHPGAILASFRRMNWSPDPEEVTHLEALSEELEDSSAAPASQSVTTDVQLVARMWAVLYRLALADIPRLPQVLVISHAELAAGSQSSLRVLHQLCGLPLHRETSAAGTSVTEHKADSARLHNFDRDPQQVADAWRDQVHKDEVDALEAMVAPVWESLHHHRTDLAGDSK